MILSYLKGMHNFFCKVHCIARCSNQNKQSNMEAAETILSKTVNNTP